MADFDVAIEHRIVQFRAADPSEVVELIDDIRARKTDQEWVTISPWVDAEELPQVTVLRRLVSSKGPKIPEITWVPTGDGPAEIGVLHAAGNNAAARIFERGVVLPASVEITQDHTKRGLLMSTPDLEGSAIVQFAMALGVALAEIAIDDRWVSRLSAAPQR